uniref:Uncharacterized protein n=1 Tax=Ignisphaera aggregans TaxID=334771 RepID=A0A7J2TAK6_9CREN
MHFWYKARRVCSGVKRYCVYVAGAVLGTTCEELKRVPEEEFEKRWKELPLPQWIYNTWRWSFIGSLLTLTGVVLTSFGL